ncbi:protein zyg-11 homolog isoform X3 [Syngnathoides biaculeatus]|uniref:protein zyg-11 homolog isoform X3 n=1 Tax=Syngnathoides biaculeatus TaxID=300417 RepID=UPI002ADD3D1A|nr:protein zyg-11 homolog isoform X3 [Syngnathoides biaculeatus]XP_061694402.1 protein zyg-11 homolog isoform X3 [Syngnathoides biaculeatus]XP_061694403.1 protein zyg-11 homolog isoform X3 [Syngnathoides biaculeatus]
MAPWPPKLKTPSAILIFPKQACVHRQFGGCEETFAQVCTLVSDHISSATGCHVDQSNVAVAVSALDFDPSLNRGGDRREAQAVSASFAPFTSEDWEDPRTLCQLCLAQLCRSLDELCARRADGSLLLMSASLFPQQLADQLLHKMASEGILNDKSVGIFREHEELRLSRVCVRRCTLSAEAFRWAVCPHRLHELDASWLAGDIGGAAIISGLASNLKCRSSLQKLSLNGLRLDWASLGRDGVGALAGLRTLDLAGTDLTDAVLQDVCALPGLENLDISRTAVTNLTALLGCRKTLRSLVGHGLCRLDTSAASLLSVLGQLDAVRHLDFSADHLTAEDGGRTDEDFLAGLVRARPKVLPSLVSLDVSGRKRISEAAVVALLEARKDLIFLGLLSTGVSSCAVLSLQKNLKVTGEANEKQLSEALRRYTDRECFSREALFHLYHLTTDSHKPQPQMLELVLRSMRSHPACLHVHLLATACVFNLITQDRAKAMSPRLLGATVAQLLRSMKTFDRHTQVQKNCLLALSSNYILQDVPFDTYLAATLAMKWLSGHEDPTLQRTAVAVFSVLVAKLPTADVAKLGEDVVLMKQLLAIVQQRAMFGVVDSTLKFALRALWNLTDEVPPAARNFVECGGLELYEEVLESYNECSIQQKVLGLLNNIAEVEELQSALMQGDLLEHIVSLLQDDQIEMGVRYFAGGVLAHVTSRPGAWTLEEKLRRTILKQLQESIAAWTRLEKEVFCYRSFRPFCRLLRTCQPPGVQLWAAWAVHFVVSQNGSGGGDGSLVRAD